jgi:DNA-binding NarL/FixJ family response regulator
MSKKLNIMIIDDVDTLRTATIEMINKSLEGLDIEADVVECDNADDGLADLCIYYDTIDFLFMGWNLPDVNGASLLSLIRENEDFDRVKIVITASEKSKQDVIEHKNLGVYSYLIKPYGQKDIDKILRQIKDRL